jgi:hypothetical protein
LPIVDVRDATAFKADLSCLLDADDAEEIAPASMSASAVAIGAIADIEVKGHFARTYPFSCL